MIPCTNKVDVNMMMMISNFVMLEILFKDSLYPIFRDSSVRKHDISMCHSRQIVGQFLLLTVSSLSKNRKRDRVVYLGRNILTSWVG